MVASIAAIGLSLGWIGPAQDSVRGRETPTIALIGATVVPMDRERVLPNHTVLVLNGRIAAVAPTDSVPIPPGASVIDARGRYLIPGLADMHVHLTPEIGARRDFGDAPLYLANGVTTVLNLYGDSTILAWRARIEAGTLLAPTLYTSGAFVNEPRVNTPEEAEREVRAQAAAGFDVIKFREVLDLERGTVLTTRGLSREAYRRMMETARAIPIPIIGHAPNNLGLEAALEDGQSLAHVGYGLLASYFWPAQTRAFQNQKVFGRGALIGLSAVVLLGWIVVTGAALRRRSNLARQLLSAAVIATVALAAALLGVREVWRTDAVGQASRHTAVTVAGILLGLGALALVWRAVRARRELAAVRLYTVLAAVVVAGLAASALWFWVPLVRRSSESGIATVAREIGRSGVAVNTTISVYRSDDVAENPEVRYVRVPAWWKRFRDNATPRRLAWSRDLVAFLQRVVAALNRERVPILAGTDAMGWAFVVPGFSLLDELNLLQEAGLSPYDALRTATIEPARFLMKLQEFGTIAPGRRADLVMVERNPLEDMSTLRKPLGVMARGRWLPAQQLDAMLAPLAADHPAPAPR